MPHDHPRTIRARLAAGEHLTADDWRHLMEYAPFSHEIADLAVEYIGAVVYRKLLERRARQWASAT